MLKNLFKILIVTLPIIVLLKFGCETKTSSEGEFDQIIVFSDFVQKANKKVLSNLSKLFK